MAEVNFFDDETDEEVITGLGDEDTSDEDTSDEDTSDEDTSDEDTSDEDTSDEDTSDEELDADLAAIFEGMDEPPEDSGFTAKDIWEGLLNGANWALAAAKKYYPLLVAGGQIGQVWGQGSGGSKTSKNQVQNLQTTVVDNTPQWLQDWTQGVATQSAMLPGYESGIDAPGMTYANSDIAGYMNPFVEEVWAPQAKRMQEDQQMELNNLRAKGGADAWGTRGALQEDLSQRRFNDRYDTAESNMLSQAYGQATGLAGKDIETRWGDYGKLAQSPFDVNKARTGALGVIGQVMPKNSTTTAIGNMDLTNTGAAPDRVGQTLNVVNGVVNTLNPNEKQVVK